MVAERSVRQRLDVPETRRELDESSSPQVYLPLLLFRSFRTASAKETNITEYGPSVGYTSKYLRPAGRRFCSARLVSLKETRFDGTSSL